MLSMPQLDEVPGERHRVPAAAFRRRRHVCCGLSWHPVRDHQVVRQRDGSGGLHALNLAGSGDEDARRLSHPRGRGHDHLSGNPCPVAVLCHTARIELP